MTDFQAVFEFAFDARPGLQKSEIECSDRDVLQRIGDVALRDSQGKPFDHGRFTDAGLTCQDRIVLPAPSQDIDDLANLEIAAEDRVDLAGALLLQSGLRCIDQALWSFRERRSNRAPSETPPVSPSATASRASAESAVISGKFCLQEIRRKYDKFL